MKQFAFVALAGLVLACSSKNPAAPSGPLSLSETYTWAFQNGYGAAGCQDENGRPCFVANWTIGRSGTVDIRATWTDYAHNALLTGLFKDRVYVTLLKNGQRVAEGSTTAAYPDNNGTTVAFTQTVDSGSYTLRVAYYSYVICRNTVTVQVAASRPQ